MLRNQNMQEGNHFNGTRPATDNKLPTKGSLYITPLGLNQLFQQGVFGLPVEAHYRDVGFVFTSALQVVSSTFEQQARRGAVEDEMFALARQDREVALIECGYSAGSWGQSAALDKQIMKAALTGTGHKSAKAAVMSTVPANMRTPQHPSHHATVGMRGYRSCMAERQAEALEHSKDEINQALATGGSGGRKRKVAEVLGPVNVQFAEAAKIGHQDAQGNIVVDPVRQTSFYFDELGATNRRARRQLLQHQQHQQAAIQQQQQAIQMG